MTLCSACGKHSYRTVRTAIRVILRCSAQRGVALRWYRCPVGGGYHLTSRTTNVKEAM